MKRFYAAVSLAIAILLAGFTGRAQKTEPDSLYINYGRLLGGAMKNFIQSSRFGLWAESMKAAKESINSLQEDVPAAESVKFISSSSSGSSPKALSDEEIYASRRNSVFMIGKMGNDGRGNDSALRFIGTAFSLSEEGVCMTNFHVLEELILPSKEDSSLIYFILGGDGRGYAINKILAYSRNNDLAMFRVNTQGVKFVPIPLGKPAVPGAAAYCISNPGAQFHFFSKGMVARNTIPDSKAVNRYSKTGVTPIRMEVTAEYGIGSSGGPIMDKCGSLIGIVASTSTLHLTQAGANGTPVRDAQMVFRATIPVKALTALIPN